MDYEIFKTEKEKLEACQFLPQLQDHPGWKLIIKALDLNIQHFQKELRTKPFESLQEVSVLQDRISDLENLKFLPENLLKEAQPETEEEPEEDLY